MSGHCCHVMTYNVTALDESDTSLLDLVAHTHGDLSQQRHLTGSTAVTPEVVEYPAKGECGSGGVVTGAPCRNCLLAVVAITKFVP